MLGDAPDNACLPGLLDAFEAALEDDLHFPAAIAELFGIAKAARQTTTAADRAASKAALREAGGLLGLLQQDPVAWLQHSVDETETRPRSSVSWSHGWLLERLETTPPRIGPAPSSVCLASPSRIAPTVRPCGGLDRPMSPCLHCLQAKSAMKSGPIPR